GQIVGDLGGQGHGAAVHVDDMVDVTNGHDGACGSAASGRGAKHRPLVATSADGGEELAAVTRLRKGAAIFSAGEQESGCASQEWSDDITAFEGVEVNALAAADIDLIDEHLGPRLHREAQHEEQEAAKEEQSVHIC